MSIPSFPVYNPVAYSSAQRVAQPRFSADDGVVASSPSSQSPAKDTYRVLEVDEQQAVPAQPDQKPPLASLWPEMMHQWSGLGPKK